jgi:hypothetical protein
MESQPQTLNLQDFLPLIWTVGATGGTRINRGPFTGEIKEVRIALDGTTKKSKWLRRPVNFHASKGFKPMLGDEIRLTEDGRRLYIKKTYRLIIDEAAMRSSADKMVEWLPDLPESVKPTVKAYKEDKTLARAFQVFLLYAFKLHRHYSELWWNPNWWWVRLENGSLYQG